LGKNLAAVLVEPVQSRRPELQPRDFLHELRDLTSREGVALIFDEMVTGFRIHPGGAQAHFDIEADLAAYSKIVGGGLPLSVIAGRGAFMDHLQPMEDGGRGKTAFFAGTFCKHPLSLAASHAVLEAMLKAGPELQSGLNERTQQLVDRLNRFLKSEQIPVRFTCFGSFFSMALSQSRLAPEVVNWLSYQLVYHGVFLRGGDRGGFLTTAHDKADIDTIFRVFSSRLRHVFPENSLIGQNPALVSARP
ncbi:MAG: aminotransferase class III-fold pyridoxal phosphate-dependent enzyme, partial [Verrucomicrobiota bacterium]